MVITVTLCAALPNAPQILDSRIGCARGRIRTCDLPLRRRPLYPLSYAGDKLDASSLDVGCQIRPAHGDSTKGKEENTECGLEPRRDDRVGA